MDVIHKIQHFAYASSYIRTFNTPAHERRLYRAFISKNSARTISYINKDPERATHISPQLRVLTGPSGHFVSQYAGILIC